MKENVYEKLKEIPKGVVFLYPYQHFMYEPLKAANYDVYDPYYGKHNIFMRLLREFSFKFCENRIKKLWYTHLPEYTKVIVAHDALITKDYLLWLKSEFKNVRIIILFYNKIDEKNFNAVYKESNCELYSSDKPDCEKYSLEYVSFTGFLKCFRCNSRNDLDYDAVYLGRCKKNRKKQIEKLENDLRINNLRTLFYKVSPYPYGLTLGIYNNPLSYFDYLKLLEKTKSIVFLSEGAQEGITYRIAESIIFHKKLITDYKNIRNFSFYKKENIFIYGQDNIEDLMTFLEQPFVELGLEFEKSLFLESFVAERLELNG